MEAGEVTSLKVSFGLFIDWLLIWWYLVEGIHGTELVEACAYDKGDGVVLGSQCNHMCSTCGDESSVCHHYISFNDEKREGDGSFTPA